MAIRLLKISRGGYCSLVVLATVTIILGIGLSTDNGWAEPLQIYLEPLGYLLLFPLGIAYITLLPGVGTTEITVVLFALVVAINSYIVGHLWAWFLPWVHAQFAVDNSPRSGR